MIIWIGIFELNLFGSIKLLSCLDLWFCMQLNYVIFIFWFSSINILGKLKNQIVNKYFVENLKMCINFGYNILSSSCILLFPHLLKTFRAYIKFLLFHVVIFSHHLILYIHLVLGRFFWIENFLFIKICICWYVIFHLVKIWYHINRSQQKFIWRNLNFIS